jgi:hypothetical protein
MNKYEGLHQDLRELGSYGHFAAVESKCDKCIIRAKCSASGAKNPIIVPSQCRQARAFVSKALLAKYLPMIKFEEVKK